MAISLFQEVLSALVLSPYQEGTLFQGAERENAFLLQQCCLHFSLDGKQSCSISEQQKVPGFTSGQGHNKILVLSI